MRRNKLLFAGAVAALASLSIPLSGAQVAPPETVETAQLPTDAFSIGALEPSEGALPGALWSGSNPQTLDFLLSHAPSRPASPSLGLAMRRTLLSPGAKPQGADASLGGKKLLALAKAGFIDEARTIASLATVGRNDLYVAEAEATLSLLGGDADAACRRGASLNGGREALFWVRLRAFCYARAGELDAFDLTVNLLRERGALASADEALFFSMLSKTPPKSIPSIETALQYAAFKEAGLEIAPGHLSQAQGGVLAAIAADSAARPALRIEAAEQAAAMGVLAPAVLKRLFNEIEFEVSDMGAATDVAAARPNDPMTDALLYQSIAAMNAPEFVRDKAMRIALALSRADSFHRAYALSQVYADDINALEGVLVTSEEAGAFALAMMATGDSVGAGRWLSAMIGENESVAALPEDLGMAFIDRVNLLALLDPQTAARIARSAGVSLLSEEGPQSATLPAHGDPAVTARILEAAFDAVDGDKVGQAGLAALAASAGGSSASGEVESVIVSEGLRAAGMPELRRRNTFERAWAASFATMAPVADDAAETAQTPEERGFVPRLKPQKS
ncbi:hypothetical protein [Hyphococcus luteus]|uniref:Antifreeze glycopeptide n=1 Tax=Hyphococcus luteus TaxID=2058213 RepID=A0A2S7K903_9PROT|nr:hypothetical protein [Marinicaulis flavus]PQA88987.1 hypothetical protein CW354_03290 [Marinicaulis flavus]